MILKETAHPAVICKKCFCWFTNFFEFLDTVKKNYGNAETQEEVVIKEEPYLNETNEIKPVLTIFEFQDTTLKTEIFAEEFKIDEPDEDNFNDDLELEETSRSLRKRGIRVDVRKNKEVQRIINKELKEAVRGRREIINEENEKIHKHCRMFCDLCPEGKQFKFKSYYEAAVSNFCNLS